VIKKLNKWLVEKGYIKDDPVIRDMVGSTARDLPASQTLLDRLDDWLADNAPEESEEVQGHFFITRIEPGRLWLKSMLSSKGEIGPIPVPERVSRACKVGWNIGGALGETAKGWRLVEVWNISP
jgi:hypothetical protein